MKLNQTLILATLTLAAFTSGARAQTQTAANAAPAIGPAAATPVASPAALPAPPVTIADIQALRDALAAQQQQIAALQAQLQSKNEAAQQVSVAVVPATQLAVAPAAAPSPASPTTVAANFQEPQSDKSNQNAGSSDERIRQPRETNSGLVPRISFSGDVRLRGEPSGGPSDESLEHARAHVRARFNAIANLGEQFGAVLYIGQRRHKRSQPPRTRL